MRSGKPNCWKYTLRERACLTTALPHQPEQSVFYRMFNPLRLCIDSLIHPKRLQQESESPTDTEVDI